MWQFNLGQHFDEVVKKYPLNIALQFSDKSHTYQELNELSKLIITRFIARGLSQGDVVTISSYKSIESFACILACLKLGITYSFVDRFSPQKRFERVLSICRPKVIICDEQLKLSLNKVSDFEGGVLSFVDLVEPIKNDDAVIEIIEPTSASIAYIMFTSGSTGSPKGVAVSHGNLAHLINWSQNQFGICSTDKIANVNSLFFDNSVFDIYSALFSGATLIVINREELKNPSVCLTILENHNVTQWFSVPSLLIYFLQLNAFSGTVLPSIKRIIFGGEGFPKAQLQRLWQYFGDRCDLINVYGPTEATCICSQYRISKQDFSSSHMNSLAPLGQGLIENFSYLIIADDNNSVIDNEIGELILCGEHVAKGYYNNTDETSKCFIQNPLHNDFIDICYKTGDLVQQDCNNLLHFKGRLDNQIKFMGYRIELEEIESNINSLSCVVECAVLYGIKNENAQITAFVDSKSQPKEIKNQLKDLIPPYMIPRKIIKLDSLPKSSNGKINRRQLSDEYYD